MRLIFEVVRPYIYDVICQCQIQNLKAVTTTYYRGVQAV